MKQHEDSLSSELASLPSIGATEGFTHEVVRRADQGELPPGFPAAGRLTKAGVAAAVGVALLAGATLYRINQKPALTTEVAEIRREHDALSLELDRLRQETREAAPVLYLGSDDQVDYVLDLSPFILSQTGGRLPVTSSNEPVSF